MGSYTMDFLTRPWPMLVRYRLVGQFGHRERESARDDELREWLPAVCNPARFDPQAVHFDDPARRLACAWYGDPDAGDQSHG